MNTTKVKAEAAATDRDKSDEGKQELESPTATLTKPTGKEVITKESASIRTATTGAVSTVAETISRLTGNQNEAADAASRSMSSSDISANAFAHTSGQDTCNSNSNSINNGNNNDNDMNSTTVEPTITATNAALSLKESKDGSTNVNLNMDVDVNISSNVSTSDDNTPNENDQHQPIANHSNSADDSIDMDIDINGTSTSKTSSTYTQPLPSKPFATSTPTAASLTTITTTPLSLSSSQPTTSTNPISKISTNDAEFLHIQTLYNDKKTITPPSTQFLSELKSIDDKLKQIVHTIDTTDDISQIQTLSEEGDVLQSQSRIKHEEKTKIEQENKMIYRCKCKAQEASLYWLHEKKDFKMFGGWKIVLKMIDKVFPLVDTMKDIVEEEDRMREQQREKEENKKDRKEIDNYDGFGVQRNDVSANSATKILENPSRMSAKTIPAPRKANKTNTKEDKVRTKKEWKYVAESTFKFYLRGKYV